MKFLRTFLLLLIGAGFTACSSYSVVSQTTQRYEISGEGNAEMDSLIAPYGRALKAEMSKVIGKTLTDLTVERPNSTMGQWVADAALQFGKDSIIPSSELSLPVIAILNTGGLRASVAAGDITVGDIYKVMPFDNQLVAVKLSAGRLEEIQKYLARTGGEPVSGFTVKGSELSLDGKASGNGFWVVTTDFLANGGDKMTFFSSPLMRIDSPKLLRDLLLHEVKARQVISVELQKRIEL